MKRIAMGLISGVLMVAAAACSHDNARYQAQGTGGGPSGQESTVTSPSYGNYNQGQYQGQYNQGGQYGGASMAPSGGGPGTSQSGSYGAGSTQDNMAPSNSSQSPSGPSGSSSAPWYQNSR